MDTVNNAIPLDDIETQVSSGIQELGRALGLSSDFLPFYINPKTNIPYGFGQPGSHKCATSDSEIWILPANVQLGSDVDDGHPFYEISTPTLSRIVQNQLNRPLTRGARLETQPTYGGTIGQCIGNRLDESLIVNHLTHNNTFQRIHITTLAWLEETGWYKVDYRKAAPELRCQALCSGRGTCDGSGNSTRCLCDDRDDSTPGCTNSLRELQNPLAVALPLADTSSLLPSPTSLRGSFVRRQLLLNTLSAPTSGMTRIASNTAEGKQHDQNDGRETRIAETGGGREHLVGSKQMEDSNLKNIVETKRRRLRVIKVDDLD
jgi:hypothetical protein